MVALGSLEHPALALSIAVYRTAEIGVGVLAALLTALLLAEAGRGVEAAGQAGPACSTATGMCCATRCAPGW